MKLAKNRNIDFQERYYKQLLYLEYSRYAMQVSKALSALKKSLIEDLKETP